MNNEFKKINTNNETRYVLENASAGATSAGNVASAPGSLKLLQRRLEELKQKISVPVTQKPRQGPLKPQTGAGAHRDKKKEQKQGKEKHRKPFAENNVAEGIDSLSFWKREAQKAGGAANINWYAIGVEHGKQGVVMNPPYGVGGKAVTLYSKGLDAGKEGVEENDQRQDHEISMASSELQSIAKDAAQLLDMVRQKSEEEGLEAWQQSKITKAADFMNSVLQSLSGDEQGVAEADKHSFIGRIQRHNELKKKVDSTWQDAADAEKRGDKVAANRAFNKHVKYANLERPGTWTDVKEKGVAEGLKQGNYNVGLEDIGKPVTVDGESGYVLLSIGYSSGNGKLTAHILQPDTGAKGTYDLERIGKGQQGVAEGYSELDDLKAKFEERIKIIIARAEKEGRPLSDREKKAITILKGEEKGVAEDDGTPGYIKYEQMKDKIASVLIKLYDQGNDEETIKQMSSRVARHLGYNPEDPIYQDAWMSSFTDASLDGSLDREPEDDYTDYTMRQGEMGREGVAEEFNSGEIGPKTARYILMKLDQGHNLTDMFDQVPELARMAEIVAGEHRLHLDDEIEQIEQIMINDLNDIVDRDEAELNEYEIVRGKDGHYYDDEGNRFDRGFQGNRHKNYVGSTHSSRPQPSGSSAGMYFYNVRPGQEADAQSVGLRQSKSGKWYSKSKNTRADNMFGLGRYWEPKNEDTNEGLRDPKDNPCWKGYKPVGTKKKGGRTVPNCVPKEGVIKNEDSYLESLTLKLEELKKK